MNKASMVKFLERCTDKDESELNSMSFDELKDLYDEMYQEISDHSTLFPNGRDIDAEDEDGV